MKSAIYLVLFLTFSQSFAQELIPNSCSLISATAPVKIINTDSIPGYAVNSQYTYYNGISIPTNKIMTLSFTASADNTAGTVSGETVVKEYAVPLRLVRETFVADFSKSVLVGKTNYTQLSGTSRYPLAFSSQGLFAREFERYNSTVPQKLVFIAKGSSDPSPIGEIVVSEASFENPAKVIVKNAQGQLEKVEFRTGIRVPFFHPQLEALLKTGSFSGIFLPDGVRFFVAPIGAASSIGSGYLIGSQVTPVQYSVSSSDGKVTLSNGEVFSFQPSAASWSTSPNGTSSQHHVVKNGQKITSFLFDGSKFAIAANSHNYLFMSDTRSSARQAYLVSAAKIKCNGLHGLDQIPDPQASDFILQKIGGVKACLGKSMSLAEFDQLVGLKAEDLMTKEKLSFQETDFLLQRMMYKDKLSLADRLFVEEAVKSKLAPRFNDLLMTLIEYFGAKVENMSLNVLSAYPGLLKPIQGKYTNVCMSESVRNAISSSYKEMIMNKMKADKKTSYSYNIQNLLFVKPYLNVLTEQHKEDIAYDAGTLLAEATQSQNTELANVFFSTLDWMSTQKVKQLFGLKAARLTDLVMNETGTSPQPFILGTDDVYGDGELSSGSSYRTAGGFYYLRSWSTSYNETNGQIDKTFRWYVGDEPFEADYKRIPRPMTFTPVLATGPNKDELLDDKILYGMVVVGANIRGTDAQNIQDNYQYYLESQGFTVYEGQEVPDAIAYISARVSGKEEKLDFFLKEAHSDGDYRNLFSINQKMFVSRAERQNGDITEIIDFMYHDDSYSPTFITNQDFGAWLKIREEQKLGGQFIYLNTSCSSFVKAAAELSAAASKNLVIVASVTSVYTFSFEEDNSTYFLFDGILKLKSFDEIAQSMQGKHGEYVFPNQQKYQEVVYSKVNGGFDSSTKIYRFNENGERQKFEIEQIINAGH